MERNISKKKFICKIKERKCYPSFCRISLGVDYDFNEMGYTGETITYLPSTDLNKMFGDDINYNKKYIYFRSLHDKSVAPDGMSTLEIILILKILMEKILT